MTILNAWSEQRPDIRVSQAAETGEGVLDAGAFKSIEVDKVFNTINNAQTTIGQAVLYRSLAQPLGDLSCITDKQEAIKEIQANTDLKASLERIVTSAKQDETYFYQLLFAKFLGSTGTARDVAEIEGYGYMQYRRGMRFMLDFVGGIQQLEKPKANYLSSVFSEVNNFTKTRAFSLMSGPVYITENGIQSKIDRKSFSPAIIFKPHLFKPLLISMVFVALLLVNLFVPIGLLSLSPMVSIFLIPMMLIYFPVIGGFDRDSCIKPL
ncbi:MAG: hypothetical protein KAI17_19305, partial [Thiotrichaceae bacterium]|nr:hypothetical protein [Thiotrichaceae bacterium]